MHLAVSVARAWNGSKRLTSADAQMNWSNDLTSAGESVNHLTSAGESVNHLTSAGEVVKPFDQRARAADAVARAVRVRRDAGHGHGYIIIYNNIIIIIIIIIITRGRCCRTRGSGARRCGSRPWVYNNIII